MLLEDFEGVRGRCRFAPLAPAKVSGADVALVGGFGVVEEDVEVEGMGAGAGAEGAAGAAEVEGGLSSRASLLGGGEELKDSEADGAASTDDGPPSPTACFARSARARFIVK